MRWPSLLQRVEVGLRVCDVRRTPVLLNPTKHQESTQQTT